MTCTEDMLLTEQNRGELAPFCAGEKNYIYHDAPGRSLARAPPPFPLTSEDILHVPRGAGAEPRPSKGTRTGAADGLAGVLGESQRGRSLFESAWFRSFSRAR